MPRATWKGILRLSLVSCPVFLTPATVKAKPIRLHRVWAPRSTTPARGTEVEQDEPARPVVGRRALQIPPDADRREQEDVEPVEASREPVWSVQPDAAPAPAAVSRVSMRAHAP